MSLDTIIKEVYGHKQSKAYSVWVGNLKLPVTPSKINFKTNNKNETVSLINGGEINIIKPPGLTDISFEFEVPAYTRPYEVNSVKPDEVLTYFEKLKNDRKPVNFRIIRNDSIWNKKYTEINKVKNIESKPSRFGVKRTTFNQKLMVTLEDFNWYQDADSHGEDFILSVNLKAYRDWGSKIINFSTDHKTATITQTRALEEPPKRLNYTIIEGDTLWKIAQVKLGSGSYYWGLIYLENKETLDKAAHNDYQRWVKNGQPYDGKYHHPNSMEGNWILPGTVITIPAWRPDGSNPFI